MILQRIMDSTVVTSCRTRERLYDEYERVALKRVAHGKGGFALMKAAKLKTLEFQIVQALHDLQEHERTHRCR